VTQLRLIGFERVLACFEPGKPEAAVLGRHRVHLGSGGLVAQ
jgi:hypothetical protein